MPVYSDIHIHMLQGVDDGPDSSELMFGMLERAYTDGTRVFCLTPHFHLGLFGENSQISKAVFEDLKEKAVLQFPDAVLTLGNELRYGPSAIDWLESGLCRTLNHTRNVLVDFRADEQLNTITNAMYRLLNSGYQPILAHAERYEALNHNWAAFEELKNKGVILQIDADSIFGKWNRMAKQMSRQLLKRRLADLVCSDAHNLTDRTPELHCAYLFVSKHYGEQYAESLFYNYPIQLLEL